MTDEITLRKFKELAQDVFSRAADRDNDSLEYFDTSKALKAYLIENNNEERYPPQISGYSPWKPLDDMHDWYYAKNTERNKNVESNKNKEQIVIYDNTEKRVGILYTLMKVGEIEKKIHYWINHTPNLDHCWLSKKQLMYYSGKQNWTEKGIGLKSRNILENDVDGAPTLSLKAWYGSERNPEWDEAIQILKATSAVSSIRWQNKDDNTSLTTEWYNYGKATVNYADDVDRAIQEIKAMSTRYYKQICEAEKLRDENLCAFELEFPKDKKINLEAFAQHVTEGRSSLKLWMTETESDTDFKRFRGIDLHTWDPIFLMLEPDYAYLTVPKKSCVNAAPRVAVLQSENTAGDTKIIFDGVEIFV